MSIKGSSKDMFIWTGPGEFLPIVPIDLFIALSNCVYIFSIELFSDKSIWIESRIKFLKILFCLMV